MSSRVAEKERERERGRGKVCRDVDLYACGVQLVALHWRQGLHLEEMECVRMNAVVRVCV